MANDKRELSGLGAWPLDRAKPFSLASIAVDLRVAEAVDLAQGRFGEIPKRLFVKR